MKKEIGKLQTVDAETLVSTPLKPIRYIVDEILPMGLHILAGKPKAGKSWLMLWLCSRIASGGDVWGLKTHPCEVLYLCLEDTYVRIQERFFQLKEDAPETLHISTIAQAIGEGLEEQICLFKEEHPDLGLVVIDTFQRVRIARNDNQVYSNDYSDLTRLKRIADEKGIGIMVVHHLRKMTSDDPFNMISGSTGLTGAADSCLVLLKESREEGDAKLCIEGRDTAYQEFHLRFDNLHWDLVQRSNQDEIRKSKVPDFIWVVAEWILACGPWQGSASDLTATLAIDYPINRITQKLNEHKDALKEKGVLYGYRRTGQKRIIGLKSDCDSSDGSDGRFAGSGGDA